MKRKAVINVEGLGHKPKVFMFERYDIYPEGLIIFSLLGGVTRCYSIQKIRQLDIVEVE